MNSNLISTTSVLNEQVHANNFSALLKNQKNPLEILKTYSDQDFVSLIRDLYKGNGWIVSEIKSGRKQYLGLSYPKTPHIIALLVACRNSIEPLSFSEVRAELQELELIGDKKTCSQFCMYRAAGYEEKTYKLTRFNLLLYGLKKVFKLIQHYSSTRHKEPQIQLFAHNKQTYRNVTEAFKTTNKVAVVQATGTGKSYLIAKILSDYKDINKLVLAPSNYILDQLKDHLSWSKDVVFMTYAKAMNLTLNEAQSLKAGFIVLDEFHRCGAEEWGQGVQQIINAFPNAKLFGTSATPIRYMDNARDMAEELFEGNVAENLSLAQAIVKNILPMPKYICALYTLNEEVKNLKQKVQNSTHTEQKKQVLLHNIDTFNINWKKSSGIPAVLKKHIKADMRKFIVFCREEDHLIEMEEKVKEWFVQSGIKKKIKTFRVLTAEPESEKNFQQFKEVNSPDHICLLFSINMLNEGLHVDEVHGVILLRPTLSPNIFYQQIGRCLKVGLGHVPLIFDFVNNFRSIRSREFQYELDYYRNLQATDRRESDLKDICPPLNIIDEVREITEVFGEISFQVDSTELRFQELKEYKERFGHCDVLLKWKENKRLGQWVVAQRMLFKKGKLSAEHIARLNELDFSWNPDERRWQEMFSRLKEYKIANGHCDVKITYKNDKDLANWVASQRSCYKADTLKEDKVKLMEDLGFHWSLKKRMDAELWEKSFNELVKFKAIHGHMTVPSKTKSLRNWVADERKKYGKGIILTKEQIKRLDDIGFQWTFRPDWDKAWNEKFNKLLEYKQKNGHLNVPVSDKLHNWVSQQRNNIKIGKTTKEQIKRLKEIGFSFQVVEDNWEKQYKNLVKFKQKEGHCFVPGNYHHKPLRHWVKRQRRLITQNKLEQWKVDKLNKLGFSRIEIQYEHAWQDKFELLKEHFIKYDQCNSLVNDKKYSKVKHWIITQRQKYKEKKLDTGKIAALEEIGFKWRYRETYIENLGQRWEKHFEELEAYLKKNNLSDLRKRTHKTLVSWLQGQKERYRAKTISDYRIEKLKSIGIIF